MDLLTALIVVNVTFFIAYFYGKQKGREEHASKRVSGGMAGKPQGGFSEGRRQGFMEGAQIALEEAEKMIKNGSDPTRNEHGSVQLMNNILARRDETVT